MSERSRSRGRKQAGRVAASRGARSGSGASAQRNDNFYGHGSRQKVNIKSWILLAAAVLAIGITIIVVVSSNSSVSAGGAPASNIFTNPSKLIVEGVYINNTSVSRMTEEQVVELLSAPLDQKVASFKLTLTYEDKKWELTAEDIGVTHNLASVAAKAMELAKTDDGKVDGTESSRIKAEGEHLEAKVTYNEGLLREKLNSIAGELGSAAVDATITFNPDAQSEQEMFAITEGHDGITVDVEQLVADFNTNFAASDTVTLPISVQFGQAKYTKEFLQACTKPLIYIEDDGKLVNTAFYTVVNGSKERRANVKLALSKFNGLALWPGDECSFNETTGERSAANGYQEAPGVAGDKSLQPTLGGGVCQASTTIYNAALIAGCEVLERNKHSLASGYVKKGFDAMVNWPNTDMRFKNISDGPIFFKTWYDNNRAYVMVYGKPQEEGYTWVRVSDIYEKVPNTEPDIIRIDSEGLYEITYANEQYIYRKATDGMKVRSLLYKTKIDTNTRIEDSVKVLDQDYYKPYCAIIYVGATPATQAPGGGSPGASEDPMLSGGDGDGN